ncbi:MAG TPA: hypothetical protein VH702_21740, partial [Vicinamibacterales bacterium]
ACQRRQRGRRLCDHEGREGRACDQGGHPLTAVTPVASTRELERRVGRCTSVDRFLRQIQLGLNLSDAFELNVECRSEARDLVTHILLEAIVPPTMQFSVIDQAFRFRHAAL